MDEYEDNYSSEKPDTKEYILQDTIYLRFCEM